MEDNMHTSQHKLSRAEDSRGALGTTKTLAQQQQQQWSNPHVRETCDHTWGLGQQWIAAPAWIAATEPVAKGRRPTSARTRATGHLHGTARQNRRQAGEGRKVVRMQVRGRRPTSAHTTVVPLSEIVS